MAEAQQKSSEDVAMTLQFPGGKIETSTAQLQVSAAVLENPDLPQAVEIVVKDQKASTAYLQRTMAIGYNKAARMIEAMEDLGYITAADHVGRRDVMISEMPEAFAKTARAKAGGVKNTPEDVAVANGAYRVTADELRSFIERLERLAAEKKDIADMEKEVKAEAKARGYDTKIMAKVIALRKRDADDIAEEEAVLDLYKEALGM